MVTATAIRVQMSRDEAALCVERINHHLETAGEHLRRARQLIYDLKELEGWRALGYDNWTQCKLEAFGRSAAQIDREYKAARLEIVIDPHGEIGNIPERVLREIPAGWSEGAGLIYHFAEGYARREGIPLTGGVMKEVVNAVADAVVTGTIQDYDGEQHPVLGRLSIDIKTRLQELDMRRAAHRVKERDYLIKDLLAEPSSEILLHLPPDAQRRAAGKQVMISVWLED